LPRDRRKAFEVLSIRGDNDVNVLGPANHPPRSKRKAANYDELHFRLRQATEDLIEGWSVHLRRAAPANWSSW